MVNSYSKSVAGEVQGSSEGPTSVMGDMLSQDTCIFYEDIYTTGTKCPTQLDSLTSKVRYLTILLVIKGAPICILSQNSLIEIVSLFYFFST